jgi:outer membrane receptor for Fe3+-dicitrate
MQPTVIDDNQRAVFNALPGLNLGEQQNPVQLNVSYRGVGNPQEAEHVLSRVDGIPIATDWIAVRTPCIPPVPQTVQSISMVRGGPALLYGPLSSFNAPQPTTTPNDQPRHRPAPLSYADDRSTNDSAVFAEGLWRFPDFHIVPSARLEHFSVSAAQTVAAAHPTIQVNTRDKIESQGTGVPGQTVSVNPGDVRSQALAFAGGPRWWATRRPVRRSGWRRPA